MIDWDRVKDLRNDVGAEDFDDIVEIFLDEVADTAAKLHDADTADLEMLTHALKNNALNLGLSQLAGLCQEGETLSRSGQAVDTPRIIDVLDASLTEFKARLPAMLAD